MTWPLALKIRIRVPKSNFSLIEPKNVSNIALAISMRWDCLEIWWDILICWLLLRLVTWCVADESASDKCFWCTHVIQSGSQYLRLRWSVASKNHIRVNEIAIALSSLIIILGTRLNYMIVSKLFITQGCTCCLLTIASLILRYSHGCTECLYVIGCSEGRQKRCENGEDATGRGTQNSIQWRYASHHKQKNFQRYLCSSWSFDCGVHICLLSFNLSV